MLEAENINGEESLNWVNLITDGSRVIVIQLNFYLYILIKIIYNYKLSCYYYYFHNESQKATENDINAFNKKIRHQRGRYSDKINYFVKDLKYEINHDNRSMIMSLISQMNLNNQDNPNPIVTAETDELAKLLLDNPESTDSSNKDAQTEIAQKKLKAIKKVIENRQGDNDAVKIRAQELLLSMQRGVTTIHIV